MDKLLLVDGHSILNRAFYGLPDLTNSKGQHTNAVLGFINIVLKIMEEEKPSHLAVAFDVHEKTFRHNMFEAYKGTRSKMPDELREQVPMIKELLKAMGVTVMEAPGFEADDILGTMSVNGENNGMQVAILSGDRDLLQLATNKVMIKIPKTKAGKTTVYNYFQEDIMKEYGVTPKEFIDMKGLMGDTSDNIPGVPGIGEKTAAKIISEYHSIEEAYRNIDMIKPKKAMENLREYYDQAVMSKVLATIKLDVPLDYSIENMKITSLFTDLAYDYIKALELKSLLKYFEIPKDVVKIDFKTNIITDLVEAELFYDSLKDIECFSIFPLYEKKEFLGMGYAVNQDIANFVVCSMFITEDFIVEHTLNLLHKNPMPMIYTKDLKALLKILPFDMNNNIKDVSLGAYLINPNKDSYDYDDLARDFCEMTLPSRKELLDKTILNPFILDEDKTKQYLAYETCIPYMVWNNISLKLKELQMDSLYEEIELPTVYVLNHMETEGIRVKRDELASYSKMLGEQITALETIIYQEAGEEFNINSPKQLGEILFEKMQLPGAKKTKTGYSTNVDVLNKLKNDYSIVENVLEYRQLTKLKSTYADGLAAFISSDERIHGTFNQTITATGRISSTEPNLQNIPMRTEMGRNIRKVFIPKDGYVFVDADYSQIELRVLAHLSEDEILIDAYRKEEDIHAITASQVFGVPLEQVDSLMRRNAKAVNFGIVYGISAFGLAEDLDISRKEASEYIEGYFKTYPKVKEYLDRTVEEAKKSGISRTLLGRIRQIPELNSSNFMQRSFGERVAMNAPIQGTAADIIKIAMINVYKRLKNEGCKSSLILQIHDELLIETHKDEVDLVQQILKEEMMNAVELAVPLCIGISVGENWYEAK